MLKIIEYMEEIEKILEKAKIPAELWYTNNKVCVDITWGDWKHRHAYADCLIMRLPYVTDVNTFVTEQDGSDCYSATHQYTIQVA